MDECASQDPGVAPQLAAKWFNDSREYERDVLCLDQGHTEIDLDEEYLQEAQDCGLEPQASPSPAKDSGSSWLSTTTASTGPRRRSGSTDSHRSASTGLTSNLSMNSTDHHSAHPAQPYALSFRSLSRPSLFDPDFHETSVPPTPRSLSSASFTTPLSPQSTVSLPLVHDSPRKPFSMRRSLNRISKLTRSNSSLRDSK